MILDPASMTIRHEGQVWAPARRHWLLVKGMSRWIDRTWEPQELRDMMEASNSLQAGLAPEISLIRKAFWERWKVNPILTRARLGYAWVLPVTLAPAVHAPAAGADEFHFRKA